MDATLNALGGILLKALPTFFLVLLLHFYLKRMFFQPLAKLLAERDAATSGARKSAESSLDKASRMAGEYEDAIRNARGDVYREQEETRKQLRDEQSAAVRAARNEADRRLREARAEIAAEAAASQAALRAEAQALAEQIAARFLPGRTA
jgi:F-type H+-transporting ATPase subunit b